MFTRAKILFICHNVVQHESHAIDKLCTRIVLRKSDYFIVHSGEDFDNLKKNIPNANVKQCFHPTYEVFHSARISKKEARGSLGIEGNTILFFGFIRPYKGLDYLIEAVPVIKKYIDIHLLIVGEFWKGADAYLKKIEALRVEKDITIIGEYVPNEDVELYFAACDLVILPYVSATGSGIVQVAFGCNKPVIATNVGCLAEVIENNKTGYIIPPRNSKAIVDAVLAFYKKNKEKEFSRNIIQEKERFSWSRIIETIEGLLI